MTICRTRQRRSRTSSRDSRLTLTWSTDTGVRAAQPLAVQPRRASPSTPSRRRWGPTAARSVSAFRLFPHRPAGCIRALSKSRHLDRRPPHLGDDAIRPSSMCGRSARRRSVRLHLWAARASRAQHDDRLHHATAAHREAWSGFSSRSSVQLCSSLWWCEASPQVTPFPDSRFSRPSSPSFAECKLLILGIMGEYLARMHLRLSRAPICRRGDDTC